jgi:hypothetical protein
MMFHSQLTLNQRVQGSNPCAPTNINEDLVLGPSCGSRAPEAYRKRRGKDLSFCVSCRGGLQGFYFRASALNKRMFNAILGFSSASTRTLFLCEPGAGSSRLAPRAHWTLNFSF